MKIVVLSSSFSGLTQRVYRELLHQGHELLQHYDLNPDLLREQLAGFQPDVIVCPFLTQRIPEDVWSNYLCLVVHPGIEGDRGASSLDWAISENWSYWGVTLLEAVEDMDAGDIWGTREFPTRLAGKTSIYKREVSTAAMELINEALEKLAGGQFKPRPLDYNAPHVKGELRDFCRQHHRAISWAEESTETVSQKLLAADTSPGVLDEINGQPMHLFGGQPDYTRTGEPGEIIGHYKGSILRATTDGAVWIRQLKCKDHEAVPPFKLPATQVLSKCFPEMSLSRVRSGDKPHPVEDIVVDRQGDVVYLYFNFYNGACNTQQCEDLAHNLRIIKQSDAKTIVFMGGEDFFSNGIHLNCIEAARDPALESWRNINAIDDVIYEMINTPDHVTVAALRNNAGAGGAIMALACDHILIRDGVVLNPHYKNMGLFGSEYWTYLLPKRVGQTTAERIINECEPLLAMEAMDINYADELLPEDWDAYHQQLFKRCSELSKGRTWSKQLKIKNKTRKADEKRRPLEEYRRHELAEMRKIFYNPDSEYHKARHAFVYKQKRETNVDLAPIALQYGT